MNRTNDTLASLDRIGQTLANPPQPQPKDEPELHEQLAAELHAAQSKWMTWSDLTAGGNDAA